MFGVYSARDLETFGRRIRIFVLIIIHNSMSANSLSTLLLEETTLQFNSFTSDDALSLGLLLIENARTKTRPVVIDITLNGHQLFRYSMQGTGPDNSEWVRRKNNVVNRFRHSSFYMGCLLTSQNTTLEEKYSISVQDYATHGGAFPLIIRNVGCVGTITVSGLPQIEDHELVTSTIGQYLEERAKKLE